MPDKTSNQLAAISRLFSSSVVRELARRGKSPLFARLANESLLLDSLRPSDRVHSLFDMAFSLLQAEGCRDEYVYKTALVRRILLGKHSLRTASMLNEFRVGECKADLVILNGTATAYEVKSERDSLSRLNKQVDTYSKVFAKVFVVAAEDHVPAVISSVPMDVGIMLLNRRYRISTFREAEDRTERVSPVAIFDSIRMHEAEKILQLRGIQTPKLPNTQLHSALRKLFIQLEPREAHEGMVAVLKRTRNLVPLSDLVSQLPTSLQTAGLSIPLRKLDHARLVSAVNTPLKDALAWA